MQGFFFIDELEQVPEFEPVLTPQAFWPFPVVNGVRTTESQKLLNKGNKYGAL